MTSLIKATLAFGFLAAASTTASAECAGHNISADAKTTVPIVTADTVAKPVAGDEG